MAVSGIISRVIILITHIRGLIVPLISTHEPPSKSLEQLDEAMSVFNTSMLPDENHRFPKIKPLKTQT